MTMHRICALTDLVDGGVAKFDVGRNTVAVVRIGDRVYAIGNRCSHANVDLSDGEVDCDSKQLECPRHGSAFSLETGEPSILPATQPIAVFVAEVRNGEVFVSTKPSTTTSSGVVG